MAGITECTVLPAVRVVFLMTRITIARSALEDSIDMATQAINIDVLAGQFEGGETVVEGRGCPTGGCMATPTTGTILAVMGIILVVAGITISGCTMEKYIEMTISTRCCAVYPGQFESG
jgi:hypothetical protein